MVLRAAGMLRKVRPKELGIDVIAVDLQQASHSRRVPLLPG